MVRRFVVAAKLRDGVQDEADGTTIKLMIFPSVDSHRWPGADSDGFCTARRIQATLGHSEEVFKVKTDGRYTDLTCFPLTPPRSAG